MDGSPHDRPLRMSNEPSVSDSAENSGNGFVFVVGLALVVAAFFLFIYVL